MTPEKVLPLLLRSYSRYYNIREENVTEPFAVEMDFHSREEQYFLVKSMRMSHADSNEYVFVAVTDHLTPELAKLYDEKAWETGMSRVEPGPSHRNSDVTLIILAETIDQDAAKYLKKLRRYNSYKHTLHGWSYYRVVAMETSSDKLVFNRMGQELKKLFRNIISLLKKES